MTLSENRAALGSPRPKKGHDPTTPSKYSLAVDTTVTPKRFSLKDVPVSSPNWQRASQASKAPFKMTVNLHDQVLAVFTNFFYDVLHLSSGRDKLLSLIQLSSRLQCGLLAKRGLQESQSFLTYEAVADNLSNSRKVFRFFKWVREVYKIRRGVDRLQAGYIEGGTLFCIPATCGLFDICGHFCSFFYFLLDNTMWAASMGIFQSKKLPQHLKKIWKGRRRHGAVITLFGGVTNIKWRRNFFSFARTTFALAANLLLWYNAVRSKHARKMREMRWNEGDKDAARNTEAAKWKDGDLPRSLQSWLRVLLPEQADDPVLFHTSEILNITCNMRILLHSLFGDRYEGFGLGSVYLSILGLVATSCGMWRVWRKVLKKKCGARTFKLRQSASMPAGLTR